MAKLGPKRTSSSEISIFFSSFSRNSLISHPSATHRSVGSIWRESFDERPNVGSVEIAGR